jgi:hypothetical protein
VEDLMDRLPDRDGRDAAGIGPYARQPERLVPLSTLESWTVAKGEPDIRGWDLRTISARSLGVIRDLLVDSEATEVVAIGVDLAGSARHAIIPIRIVQIDRTARVVLMDSADLDPDSDSGVRIEGEVPVQPARDAGDDLRRMDSRHARVRGAEDDARLTDARLDDARLDNARLDDAQLAGPPRRDHLRDEVVVERPAVIERGHVPGDRPMSASAMPERRQGERRRIDRTSSEI